jgi:hypothetical protein
MAIYKMHVSMARWIERSDVKEAFGRLVQKHGLQADLYERSFFPLLDFQFGMQVRAIPVVSLLLMAMQWYNTASMQKARAFGFFGCCDSITAHREVFEAAAAKKMLPSLDLQAN